jgi:hypothetical protein
MEDETPGTPELKRTYLSLLPHAAIVELVLALDAGRSGFPADLRGEVRRMQAAADDADGEGSPDPPPVARAPSVPPAGGPRTRAGAARAYAAALASKSARPSPAPAASPPVSPAWQHSSPTSPGPVRTPAKKTRTGVIGGYNPITSIGPSSAYSAVPRLC